MPHENHLNNSPYPEFLDSFKYSEQIRELIDRGIMLDETITALQNEMVAYRFAHSEANNNNHKPVYVISPRRIISPISQLSTSGYALSCFNTEDNAESAYRSLSRNFKKISQTIGDALTSGSITSSDGMITSIETSGHFDLYEYSSCDLNVSFTLVKQLQ